MPPRPSPAGCGSARRYGGAIVVCGSAGIVAGAFLWPLVSEPTPAFGLASVDHQDGRGHRRRAVPGAHLLCGGLAGHAPHGSIGRCLNILTDAADPRLADYTRLRDVDLRKSLEAERGLFVAEGEKVIRRAIAAGYPVSSVLTTRRWVDSLADVLGTATVYVVSDETMEGVAGFQVHRGALASMERLPLPSTGPSSTPPPASWSWRTSWTTPTSARSSGAPPRWAWTASSCRRAAPIRSTGGRSRCPWGRCSPSRTRAWTTGTPAWTSCAEPASRRWPSLPTSRPPRWTGQDGRPGGAAAGAEGDGLSSRWLHEADEPVCIPMSPSAMANGVDSLNVVAAAAIACHGLMRSADLSHQEADFAVRTFRVRDYLRRVG